MCGRTCCTLAPDLVPYACTVVTKGRKLPQWKEAPCGGHYTPSTNVPPTAYTPILYNDGESKIDDILSTYQTFFRYHNFPYSLQSHKFPIPVSGTSTIFTTFFTEITTKGLRPRARHFDNKIRILISVQNYLMYYRVIGQTQKFGLNMKN